MIPRNVDFFPKIKVYSPSSQTLSDLSQVRRRALMAVCVLYYSYYGLCGCVDDGKGDIVLMSLPSICAGLPSKVLVRKISTRCGTCSSQQL